MIKHLLIIVIMIYHNTIKLFAYYLNVLLNKHNNISNAEDQFIIF